MHLKELFEKELSKEELEDTNVKKTIENSKPHELEGLALNPKHKMGHRLMALKKIKGKDVTEKDLEDLQADVKERFKKNEKPKK